MMTLLVSSSGNLNRGAMWSGMVENKPWETLLRHICLKTVGWLPTVPEWGGNWRDLVRLILLDIHMPFTLSRMYLILYLIPKPLQAGRLPIGNVLLQPAVLLFAAVIFLNLWRYTYTFEWEKSRFQSQMLRHFLKFWIFIFQKPQRPLLTLFIISHQNLKCGWNCSIKRFMSR